MTLDEARKVLGDAVQPNGGLRGYDPYFSWILPYPDSATLDGNFTPEQLEAIAWWMRRHHPGAKW